MSNDWKNYSETRPPKAGVYEWRVPSVVVPGLVLILVAHMRERGAGHERVLSPQFDYWTGWHVTVPDGLQWRESSQEHKIREHENRLLAAEGVEFSPCLFCGKTPRLKAIDKSGDGVMMNPFPQRLNTFWLECCAWARTPHLDDPRLLEEPRQKARQAAQKEMSHA